MAYLRPDEEASKKEIERSKNMNRNAASLATSVAGGAALFGSGIVKNILPLLSEYVPAELAMKGINKISPKLGEYLRKGQESGLDIKEGLNFLRDKIQGEPQKKEMVQAGNIIGQFSPELQEFVEEKLKQGMSTDQASAVARVDSKFSPLLPRIEKQANMKFSEILRHMYGEQEAQQAQAAPMQQEQAQSGADWNQIMQMAQQFLG